MIHHGEHVVSRFDPVAVAIVLLGITAAAILAIAF